jgi:aminoglycoside phosphotransferase (APT) family kinase protein
VRDRRPPPDPTALARGNVLGRGRTAEVVVWGPGLALKWFHPDVSADAVAAEVAAARIVHALALPAPALVDQIVEDGRAGLVFERMDGPAMLHELSAKPWRMRRDARALAALQVRIQAATGAGLPPLRTRLAERIGRADLPAARRDELLADLDRLPVGDRLCHGDVHPANLLRAGDSWALIDWADATSGHPDADAARTRLLLEIAPVPPGTRLQPLLETARNRFARAYVAAYRALRPHADLDGWDGVVAGARLAEAIDDERHALLARLHVPPRKPRPGGRLRS